MTDNHEKELIAIAEQWLANNNGKRKSTINDIARLAGVSKKTVSRVINNSSLVKDSTRKDVQTIIKAINFQPDMQARGLAFRHAFLVGVIYDNPNPQYIVNMQQGILDGLKGTGYELVVHPSERGREDYIEEARQFIERQKLRGVILTPSISEDEEMAKMLREINCDYIRIASVKLDDDKHMIVSYQVVLGGIVLLMYFVGKLQNSQNRVAVFQMMGRNFPQMPKLSFNLRAEMIVIGAAVALFIVLRFYPWLATNAASRWFHESILSIEDAFFFGFVFKVIGFFFMLNMLFQMAGGITFLLNGGKVPNSPNRRNDQENRKNDNFDDYEEVE